MNEKKYTKLVEETNLKMNVLDEETVLKMVIEELEQDISDRNMFNLKEDVKSAIVAIKNKEKLGIIKSELLNDIKQDDPKNIYNLFMVLKKSVETLKGEEKQKIQALLKIIDRLYSKITSGEKGDAESVVIKLKKQKGFKGKVAGIN